jgi:8-oxo-dGTP pyrophosphatase MutT (NUDIX family)
MQPHRSPEALEFTTRLRARLADRSRRTADGAALRCAAVLVPLLVKDGEWHVVVTQRSQAVEHHKGQISFPGGACDADDADRLATALRETEEEIGVPPEAVEVLGALDDLPTISHFAVTPYVGVIPHPFPYRRQEREVEAVVEVPLGFLSEPGRLRVEQWNLKGLATEVLFWEYGGYTIWGATARILKGLLDVIERR